MGKIVSDFPSLPKDTDAAKKTAFAAVAAEFKGRALPLALSDTPTRAEVLGHLQTVAGALIAAELAADKERPESMTEDNGQPRPEGTVLRLYEGKSDAQIADTFNTYRAGAVLVGVPFCPNAITAEDVSAAKKG